MDADIGASFRARGLALDTPGSLGMLLRREPDQVLAHYRAEVRSRVDVLSALTADTTPRALAEVGMQHRSAMLTSLAVDLAFEAAAESDKAVAIAGVLGSEMVSAMAVDRLNEELSEHAARLKVAGCELLLARGQGSRPELLAAVAAAASTGLPTWAVVECLPNGELSTGGSIDRFLKTLAEAGAHLVLLEVGSVTSGLEQMARVHRALEALEAKTRGFSHPGVLLAGSHESVRGFASGSMEPERWVHRALELEASGYRVIGGGAGTTEAHTAALATALGALHPSVPPPPPPS
jgi:methionine synthase I (cobalamin-dependent)